MTGKNGQLIGNIYLARKMDDNIRKQTMIKVGGVVIVVADLIRILCGIYDRFILSIPAVILVICLLIYYVKKHKELEWKFYSLSPKDLEEQKKLAERNGESLPEAYANYRIKEPDRNLHFPLWYFAFLIVSEIVTGLLIR